MGSCDLLENSYLCGSNNNYLSSNFALSMVVICLKIPTFVVATTTHFSAYLLDNGCDLLENSYLCGSNNNSRKIDAISLNVVICLKIPTFVVATTTICENYAYRCRVVICLKIPTFVVATTTYTEISRILSGWELLENSYLCGSNNNS